VKTRKSLLIKSGLVILAAGLIVIALPGGCKTSEMGSLVEASMLLSGKNPEEAKRAGQAASSMAGALAPISVENEISLGGGVAVQAFSQIGKRHADEDLQRYVNLVGKTVAANGTRPDLPYAFAVLDSPIPNAFAGPGGYIFVTTGALKAMKDESELAGVLAHEVGHITQKHMLQTYQRTALIGALSQGAAVFDKDVGKYTELVDVATQTLFDKGLDKKFEYEADSVGVEIAALTGYDPSGLGRFLRKLETMTNTKGGWFKTHPPLSDRINKINIKLATQLNGVKGVTQRERFQKMIARLK